MSILSFYQRGLQKLADAEKSVASRLSGGLKGLGSAQNQIAQQAAQSIQQTARPTTNTTNVLTNAVKQVNSGIQSLPSVFTTFKQRVQSGDIPEQYKPTQFNLLQSKTNSAIRPITQLLQPYTKPINKILHPSTFISSDPQKSTTQKAILSFFDKHPKLKKETLSFAKGFTEDVPGSLNVADVVSGLKSGYNMLSVDMPTDQDFRLSSQYSINKARGLSTTPEMELANKKVNEASFNTTIGSMEGPFKVGKNVAQKLVMASESKLPAALNIIKPAKNSATQSLAEKLESNIRMDKLGITSESAQQELKRILDDGENFSAQRRGVRTHQMTEEAADQILPKIKLKPGTILNAEEKHALGNVVKGYSNEIDSLAKAINDGANSDDNLLQLAKLRTNYNIALASLSGSSTEAARSLEANKMINKLLADPRIRQDEQMMKQALKFSGGREGIELIAKRLGQFGDDTVGKYKFIQSLNKPTNRELGRNLINWYWYTSILSNPITQARNIIGNAAHLSFILPSKLTAGAWDATVSAGARLKGKPRARAVYAGELPSEIKGLITGSKEAYRKSYFMFKNGFTIDDVATSEFSDIPEAFSRVLKGKLALPANVVSRSMGATDQFFKTLVASSELHALAYKNAKNKGLKGDAFKKAVAEFIADPPPEAIISIQEVAQRATFQNPNALSNAFNMVGSKIEDYLVINPVDFFIPFIKTPSNVLARNLEASPLGIISARRAAKMGNSRLSSQIMGKAILGSMGLYSMWNMALEGKITGSGPKDKAQREALYRTGWRPNSLKIGDRYYSYQLLTPLNVALAAIGNTHDAMLYDGLKVDKDSISAITYKTYNTIKQASFLSGVNNLLQADSDGDFNAIFKQQASSAVPLSGLLRSINKGRDPYIRETDTIFDAVKSNIPGLRESLPIKKDIFGQDVKYEGNWLQRVFDPFNSATERTDRESDLVRETMRLGVDIAMTDKKEELTNLKTSEKITLNPQQKEQYSIGLGQIMRDTINAAISSPEYQSMNDDEKRTYLEEHIADAKKFIDGSFFIDSLSPEQKRELSIKVIDYSVAVPTETKDLEVFDPQSGSKIDLSPEDKSAYYERMWQGIYDTVTTGEQREEFQYLDPEQKKSFINSQVSNLKSFMKDGFTMFKNDEEGFFDGALRLKLQIDADTYLKNAIIDNAVKKTIEVFNNPKQYKSSKEFLESPEIKLAFSKLQNDEDANRFYNGVQDALLSKGQSEYNKFLLQQDSETRAIYIYQEFKKVKTKKEGEGFVKKIVEYSKDGILDVPAQDKFMSLMQKELQNESGSQNKNENNKKQLWPTQSKDITSTYGWRSDASPAWHSGVDIGGQMGDPVYSSKAGTVVQLDSSPDEYGNSILVDHGNGITTRYAHLSGFNVKVGDSVSQGDVIGSLGSTGNSTGPHLHYEVLQDNKQIDPMKYEEFSY